MAKILVRMGKVLNITNNGKALSESLRTHFGNITLENGTILQAPQ